MTKLTYEAVCQKHECKNVVTGYGAKLRPRTCFDCKAKRINKRYHDTKPKTN